MFSEWGVLLLKEFLSEPRSQPEIRTEQDLVWKALTRTIIALVPSQQAYQGPLAIHRTPWVLSRPYFRKAWRANFGQKYPETFLSYQGAKFCWQTCLICKEVESLETMSIGLGGLAFHRSCYSWKSISLGIVFSGGAPYSVASLV